MSFIILIRINGMRLIFVIHEISKMVLQYWYLSVSSFNLRHQEVNFVLIWREYAILQHASNVIFLMLLSIGLIDSSRAIARLSSALEAFAAALIRLCMMIKLLIFCSLWLLCEVRYWALVVCSIWSWGHLWLVLMSKFKVRALPSWVNYRGRECRVSLIKRLAFTYVIALIWLVFQTVLSWYKMIS